MGQCLPSEAGATYDVFRLQEDQRLDEEGEECMKKEFKLIYLYVPDVTKEERMVYLRISRLEPYIACPLVYNSMLNEEGIKESLRAQEEKENQQKEREIKKF